MSKVLGIDYGSKHVGLAISDDDGRVALPYQTITFKTSIKVESDKLLVDLGKLIELENIELIILGLPLNSRGLKTKLGDQIFHFAQRLEQTIGVSVEVMDERGTSKLAASLPYKTSRNIHELSAQILLQDYLDRAK